MPIDVAVLSTEATAAYAGLIAKGPNYVRGGEFIKHFQRQARYELERMSAVPPPLKSKRSGVREFTLRENGVVLGAYFPKELDVYLEGSSSGPLLGISFKCMMSGIGKNVNNRWEELVGDASNLHSRYPMLALGYVMILPTVTRPVKTKSGRIVQEFIIDENGEPTKLAQQIEGKLRGIRGRQKPVELPTTYEEVALAVVDFNATPPVLHKSFPSEELRLETFYDKLVANFRERNQYLESGDIEENQEDTTDEVG